MNFYINVRLFCKNRLKEFGTYRELRSQRLGWGKEYIERRHGEPFKFLFLPKMGLLGSQAVLEKKVQF